jgi:hypothetical protein
MIAVRNRVIPVMIQGARVNKADRVVNKADRVVKKAQGAVIQKTRDSKAEQTGAISKDNRVSKVKINREAGLIVIARDSKAICPTGTASKVSKKKLLQIGIIHLMMMTKTQTDLKDTDGGMSNR